MAFKHHDTGTQGVAIVLDDLGQFPDQRFGLFGCESKGWPFCFGG
jgi:hypothetical protein